VVNTDSNNLSIINGTTNSVIKTISVGPKPTSIVIDSNKSAIYVANADSNSVSVVDTINNVVVGKFFFKIHPSNSGYIDCGNKIAPTEKIFYITSGTLCTAVPNKGFEFLSWDENIGNNSTQTVTVSKSATSIESILDLIDMRSKEPEAALNITRFGSFTANFKQLPPAFPPEYWIPLYGIVASSIVGWSIPSVIGWARSKIKVRRLNHYHQKIKSLFYDGVLDNRDISLLDNLVIDITDAYSKGKIYEIQHNSLKNEITILYDRILRNSIDVLTNSADVISSKKDLQKLKINVEKALSEQKITQTQFELLIKKFSDLGEKDNADSEKRE
jgi:YVTN family beta-propeller protein